MTEAEQLGRAAGLGEAWKDRQVEVAQAITLARAMAAAFPRPTDERAEPMPAFAVPAGGPRA